MEKLKNCYSINLDDETAQRLEHVAKIQQRKPRELLRLLVSPVILAEFIKSQLNEHPENQQAQTFAHFTPSTLDKLPKL